MRGLHFLTGGSAHFGHFAFLREDLPRPREEAHGTLIPDNFFLPSFVVFCLHMVKRAMRRRELTRYDIILNCTLGHVNL